MVEQRSHLRWIVNRGTDQRLFHLHTTKPDHLDKVTDRTPRTCQTPKIIEGAMPDQDEINETYVAMLKTGDQLNQLSRQIVDAVHKADSNRSDEHADSAEEATKRSPSRIPTQLKVFKRIVGRTKEFLVEAAALTLLISWGFWLLKIQKIFLWEWRIWIAIALLIIFAVLSIVQASIPNRIEQEQFKQIFQAGLSNEPERFKQLIASAIAEREGRFLLIVEISIAILLANTIVTRLI